MEERIELGEADYPSWSPVPPTVRLKIANEFDH